MLYSTLWLFKCPVFGVIPGQGQPESVPDIPEPDNVPDDDPLFDTTGL